MVRGGGFSKSSITSINSQCQNFIVDYIAESLWTYMITARSRNESIDSAKEKNFMFEIFFEACVFLKYQETALKKWSAKHDN